MKRHLVAFAIGSVGLSACFGSGDGDVGNGFNGSTGNGTLDVAWGIEYLGDTSGTVVPCAEPNNLAGTQTVDVVAFHKGTQQSYTSSFVCGLGAGLIALPSGQYSVTFNLEDDVGDVVSTLTVPDGTNGGAIVIRNGATTPIDVFFVIQSFAMNWQIQRAGLPLTCAAAFATTVELETALSGSDESVSFSFPCASMAGITSAVPTGSYLWSARLLDANGAVLSQTVNQTFVASATQRAVLPAVSFVVAP
ncbi:MAG: hypothetical protein SGI86_01945 [Deltaproteobacteria bacterium]|nr:hypothetical protein [Deltaproteobacteria bacterium]